MKNLEDKKVRRKIYLHAAKAVQNSYDTEHMGFCCNEIKRGDDLRNFHVERYFNKFMLFNPNGSILGLYVWFEEEDKKVECNQRIFTLLLCAEMCK